MKISSVQEMRHLDQTAIQEFGIIEEILMENASDAAYTVISREIGIERHQFLIICGVGNNGGDGLVVARKIHSNGGQVKVIILSDPAQYKGAAKTNFNIISRLPLDWHLFTELSALQTEIAAADVLIDAIFGTGLDREVGGKYREIIQLMNASGKPVVSLDIPSGIHGDTGQIMGIAVKANYTITFGLPKIGNLLFPGFEWGGKLFVSHISFPPLLYQQENMKIEINSPIPLPRRQLDSHKGNYGKVLFIAGSSHYLGAPYFAALSLLKAGGGLSFLATPETVSAFIGNKGSEIIFMPQKVTSSGSLAYTNKAQLLDFSQQVDFVVIGPGLSLNEETQKLVRELVAEINRPVLIDGDGITAVAHDLSCLSKRQAATILTPHLGEMARIVRQELTAIQIQKIDILQKTASKLPAIIVLKGAHSLIGLPEQNVFINLSGNPGMATAGSGDVLTGTIAAMAGLGFAIPEAVRMGVFLHGFAGDLAAIANGEDGILAGDIMNFLPEALKLFRTQFNDVVKNYYQRIFVV